MTSYIQPYSHYSNDATTTAGLGYTITDKVYAPSTREIERYYKTAESRIKQRTDFAWATFSGDGYSLRSGGIGEYNKVPFIHQVGSNGSDAYSKYLDSIYSTCDLNFCPAFAIAV